MLLAHTPDPALAGARLKARSLEEKVTAELASAISKLRSSTFVGPSNGPIVFPPEPDPEDYVDHRRFAEDYLMASILSKATTFDGEMDTELAARVKFFDAETHNRLTNGKLSNLGETPPWVKAVSRELCRILGPLDETVLNRIADDSGFGPGACVGVTGELVPSKKYDSRPMMTEELAPLFPALAGPFVTDYWSAPPFNGQALIGQGNHHFTVPKNRETDRNAAKELLWNSKLQNGIGKQQARRLKLFGVDIHDQTRNQNLASLAQQLNLATLDLSQASDLICHMCIWLLLTTNGDPQGIRWWHLMNLARAKRIKICRPGDDTKSWHTLEMYCSMGNGFTFTLESAVFLAVCRTVVGVDERHHLAVYGDDMIVPQSAVADVVDRLEYLGFKVNTQKSCLAGKFFESCGTDWFDSRPVRPFFLRYDPESPVPYPLSIANALRLWLRMVYGCCPKEFQRLWIMLKSQVPKAFANPVPDSMGDVGLISSFEEFLRSSPDRPQGPWEEGWLVRHAHVTSVTVDRRTFGVLAYALATAASTDAFQTWDEPIYDTYQSVYEKARLRKNAQRAQRSKTTEATRGFEAVRNQFGQVLTKKTQVPRWHLANLNWV